MKLKLCKKKATFKQNAATKLNFLSLIKYLLILTICFIILFMFYFQNTVINTKQIRKKDTRIKLTKVVTNKLSFNSINQTNLTNLTTVKLNSNVTKLILKRLNKTTRETTTIAITKLTAKLKWYEKIIKKIKGNTNDLCPLIPPNLGTRVEVDKSDSDYKTIENKLKHLPIKKGGLSSPTECESRYKVAIIVPYRNRETNLKIFIRHMHPFLIKQQLDYGIYLVEPLQNITFNRGLLMNIGFIESLKLTNNKWDCFIFHDVDLIPEDERNIYSCPELPRHMSSAVSTFNYK